ncbi:MAG: energy-coupling factor transporter ATPase [Acetivibrio sp.]
MGMILDHVNYVYSSGLAYEKKALKDINLKIGEGEFIGLIGHTGSGKSTLIQHLNGLLRATSGNIYYNGQDIYEKDYNMKEHRTKVGLVFQYPEHQLFETTVIKDVKFGPGNQGLPQLEIDLRAYDALKQVGITDDMLDASPFELSGGQKRRVAIAGVLAMKPEVLILDEPTAGLDPKGRDEILDQIGKLHEESKITVILVSHSMEDVAKYVNRLIVMNQGEILLDNTPKKVFSYYKEMEQIGLAAPQVTYVLNALKENGCRINTEATTVKEAAEEIIRFAKTEGLLNMERKIQ